MTPAWATHPTQRIGLTAGKKAYFQTNANPGRTGLYLEPVQGAPRHNVLDMAREGLQIELASAMRECLRLGADVTREGLLVQSNGADARVNLTVSKLVDPEPLRGLLLVTLRPAPPPPPEAGKPGRRERKGAEDSRLMKLERELQYMKESHQTTLEELETSNEELKSTNEELQSTNEELQSTNEELETSKEEMQSLNEELTTVNAELQSKVEELSQANNDMQNLLNSTNIATIFLDNDLNIKRFTQQAKDLVMVRPADVGRPITELASNLKSASLAADCREVLRTLILKETEIATTDGGVYLMRIMPYRTLENVIEGLVLTFVNIGKLKQAEAAGETARAYFESIVETVREPLLILDRQLRVVSANRSFYRVFRTTPSRTEGELVHQLGAGEWNIPKLRELLEEMLAKDTVFEDCEVEVEIPKLGRRVFLLNARRLERPGAAGVSILLAFEDMAIK